MDELLITYDNNKLGKIYKYKGREIFISDYQIINDLNTEDRIFMFLQNTIGLDDYYKLYENKRNLPLNNFLYTKEKNIYKPFPVEKNTIPQNIKDALELTNLAQEYQKDIQEKTITIQKKKNEYFKKHGTLIEKIGAKLNLI